MKSSEEEKEGLRKKPLATLSGRVVEFSRKPICRTVGGQRYQVE